MILVRTNPKIALVIVCLTLLTSIFTVWMVTRSTDKAVQQSVALQQRANQSVKESIAAAKAQPGVSDDVQAQIDAAQKQLEAAAK